MRSPHATSIVFLGAAVILAACGAVDGGQAGPSDATDETAPADDETAPADGSDTGAQGPTGEALADRDEGPGVREGFFWQLDEEPSSTIDTSEIIRGGPPPDGIPPIDRPRFESLEEAATWLSEDSPVMVVRTDEETRAYPLAILTWHEIVNDTIAGEPVVVTYCPLCNSGLAFSAEIDGMVLDFGTSGRLWRSNLVMYDRQYGNLWTQFTGEAVVGERFLGQRLERIPTTLQGFAEVRRTDPDAVVLSRETGHNRDYGRNPYTGYDAEGGDPFMFRDEVDGRFDQMTRVVGFPGGDGTAVPLDLLAEQQVIEFEHAGDPVTLWWAPGQASALDTADIDAGRDVGQTAAFIPEVDGRRLTFEPATDVTADDSAVRFRDAETGSGWTLAGRAVEGDLAGEELTPVALDDTFWFVWSVFKPSTDVIS